ncbi:MAG: L-threonylcarbamoyladenylate synthase [Patescibacteria group bacterium]
MARVTILRTNSRNPSRDTIHAAARIIKKGGVVALPTETVYGLAANPFSIRATRKIFKIKGRSEKKPLLILIGNRNDVYRIAKNISGAAEKLMDALWPGPLTIVFKKKKIVPHITSGGTDTIGVRLSPHPVPRALIKALGTPITAPSANISGHPTHQSAHSVARELGDRGVALILDGGKTTGELPSTVIDATKRIPKIIREGAVSEKQIRKILG